MSGSPQTRAEGPSAEPTFLAARRCKVMRDDTFSATRVENHRRLSVTSARAVVHSCLAMINVPRMHRRHHDHTEG